MSVSYNISLKKGADKKRFLDALRCRNDNLNITRTLREYEEKRAAGGQCPRTYRGYALCPSLKKPLANEKINPEKESDPRAGFQ